MKVFSIYDQAAGVYGRPFFVQADGLASRVFMDEVNRPAEDNPIYRHPGDFSLYKLGEWSDETGEFIQYGSPELVMRASAAVKKSD